MEMLKLGQKLQKTIASFAIPLCSLLATAGAADPHENLKEFVESRTKHRQEIQKSLENQYQALEASMSWKAKAGFQHLTENVYLPADFDEDVLKSLDAVDHQWPFLDQQLPQGTRQATWMTHGLSPRPNNPKRPLQYVVNSQQQYVMNCFACHGGSLYGTSYPGAPNSTYALESLTEQVRKAKIKLGKPLAHMDLGSMVMPLGTTNGTSNAVMFGVALMNFRDADLNVQTNRIPAPMTHHDMDAPPWWHFYRKSHLYIDGFAEKGHKGLMQFMLVRQNGPEKFRYWEKDFRDVYRFLEELRPPKFPLAIDSEKASKGKIVFENTCASCHGTYQQSESSNRNIGKYPEQVVDIDDVNTDRVRFDSLSPKHRDAYGKSWFADYGKQTTYTQVTGYVAPPLDGIWASAPYLHNGSIPTLWHLLHPQQRPVVWRRIAMSMDEQDIGLVVESLDEVPKKLSNAERRWYFDTRVEGKSAQGHSYPDDLTEEQKSDLLEYLKTL
jgi:mono/diheme cytochrome c family protein